MAGIKKEYDVIIIGAGPSGIFCAYELMRRKPDLKVLMLEKGRSIERRVCPKRKTKVCVGCNHVPLRPDLREQVLSRMENFLFLRKWAEHSRKYWVMRRQRN